MFNNPWEKADQKLVTIEVTHELEEVSNADTGVVGHFYKSKLINDNEIIPLILIHHEQYRNLFNPDTVRLQFRLRHLSDEIITELPATMSRNLGYFIAGGRRAGVCCMDFVNDLFFGCGKEKLNSISIGKLAVINESTEIKIGEAISIGHFEAGHYNPVHFAIAIGGNLYLSVTGPDKPLQIATVEQLKLLYSAHLIVKIEPLCSAVNNDVPGRKLNLLPSNAI